MSQSVYNRLMDQVGSLVGDRVYPTKPVVDQEELPCLVYSVTVQPGEVYLSGSVSDLTRSAIQVDVYAETEAEARSVAQAVRSALHGWREPPVLVARVGNIVPVTEELGHHLMVDGTMVERGIH